MLILFLFVIFIVLSFVLWCLLHVASQYDQMIDDEEQEAFLREYQKEHHTF